MRRSLLICVGSVALALTAGAQTPDNQKHRKTTQRTTTYSGYRGTTAVRQTVPQRTFSTARYRQPALSTERYRQPTFSTERFHRSAFSTTRTQPRTNTSFANRSAMASNAARSQRRLPVRNDWSESRFGERPRPSNAFANRRAISDIGVRRQARFATATDRRESKFTERSRPSSALVNRPAVDDIAARRQARLSTANVGRESKFSQRARPSSQVLKRFTMNDAVGRRETRTNFNNNWVNSRFTERKNSFVNKSRSAAFWRGTRAGVTNNWKGGEFSGRQYSAFHNYNRQWHDRGWWDNHCGDRIVFVTVYSQPFPFYFDAGYWYPAWGYYPDSYYPYDGPIYGYNDLPPGEVVANVQTQLYYEGYYDGPIDGILGPDTRAAIADYQADHGLAVTAAIDEPTVESLGLA
jgi:hypothetical protein